MRDGLRVGLTALGAWLLVAVLAVANGLLREGVLIPALGDAAAQIASVAILVLVVLLVQWGLVRGPWSSLPQGRLWLIGSLWVAGTVLFEFALGRLVLDLSWSSLIAQYNILEGRLWPLVPLTLLLGMPVLRAYRRRD